MEQTKVELLAPAGNPECFIAAIKAGADAVYLGLEKFGARAYAGNFTIDELLSSLKTAHILGRRIYLTVNTLFKDDELNELYDLLYDPYINGLDGVIVQDVGVMSYINRQFPDLPLHVSTQAGITEASGVEYLKKLNVKRIVPARELNLSEIKKLRDDTGLEIECFIHGSLCYSYSGKCLLSSFIGGRSGNRGKCAQPCRLSYENGYPLSMKDLCTIDLIPELIDAGISSFKIEGRMKSASYVFDVTSVYRKCIDGYCEGLKDPVSDDDRKKLISLYTRSGNCTGYYYCHNGKDMITPDSPSYTDSSDAGEVRVKKEPSISVKFICTITDNRPATIRVYNDNISVSVTTSSVAAKAVSRALTPEEVRQQLIKTGGTSFTVSECEVKLDDNLFLAKSSLNSIRREGLEAFEDKLLSQYRREDVVKIVQPDISKSLCTAGLPEVNVSILSEDQVRSVLDSDADSITVPIHLYEKLFIEKGYDAAGKKVYISLPYVIREESRSTGRKFIEEFIKKAGSKNNIEGFYVSNHESAQILNELGLGGRISGDIYLYAANRQAYDFYKSNGIRNTTVPVELNVRELKRRGITGEELIVYGRIPVMVSANCICNTLNGCNRQSAGNKLYITDRKGEKLFVHCDCSSCTNTVYNSAILSVSDEKDVFDVICPSSVRFSFTDEKGPQIRRILASYFEDRMKDGHTEHKLIEKYTRGHLKRGVD